MHHETIPVAVADDPVALRIAEVVDDRRRSRIGRLVGGAAMAISGVGTAGVAVLPLAPTALTMYGVVMVSSFVFAIFATFASTSDKDYEEPLRQAVSDAVPASWMAGTLQPLATFIEELKIIGKRGLEEYDRVRIQTIADAYGDALLAALPDDPWDEMETLVRTTSHGHSPDPAKMQLHLQRDTLDILSRIESGPDWRTSRSEMQTAIMHSYPATLRMAERFGIDMGRAKRPTPVPLPGEAGAPALPPPVPADLLELMGRYRAIDPATMRDEDRIAGTALLRNDIPMTTDAWRRASLASGEGERDAIDAHYRSTMSHMAATLNEILEHVAADARQEQETAERYIRSKHGSQDPFEGSVGA